MTEYYIPTQASETEFVEKRSRFIGHVWRVDSEEEARARIEEMKKRYYDARHNCWCYLIKDGPVRYSDDGEPQGTAGQPMLNVFQREGVVNVVCVVTRYFGGILLGGGGLIRAYSHTASIALAAAGKIQMRECLLLSASCDYSLYGKVAALVPECGGVVDDTQFLERVSLSFHLAPEQLPALERKLADATSGRCSVQEAGRRFFPFAVE